MTGAVTSVRTAKDLKGERRVSLWTSSLVLTFGLE